MTDATKRLTEAFESAIATRSSPSDDWVQVGAGFLSEAIDYFEWLEKGNAEWRDMYLSADKQAKAARATARVAIGHLNKVLNECRTAPEQQGADTEARDWLASIGAT